MLKHFIGLVFHPHSGRRERVGQNGDIGSPSRFQESDERNYFFSFSFVLAATQTYSAQARNLLLLRQNSSSGCLAGFPWAERRLPAAHLSSFSA